MAESRLNRFDAIAPYYDRLATLVFGKAIKDAQLVHLKSIPAATHILVLGGGTGWWLNDLLAINTTCIVYYVEASAAMLHQAKRNSDDSERVRFVHGTENDVAGIHFDVIITYFFLDMFEENQLDQFVPRMRLIMKPAAIWIVAEFTNCKYWHKFLLRLMYFFFNVMGALDLKKLPQWRNTIEINRFKLIKSKKYFGEFIHSHVYRIS